MDRTVRSEYYKRHQKVGIDASTVIAAVLAAGALGAAYFMTRKPQIQNKSNLENLPVLVKSLFDVNIRNNKQYKKILDVNGENKK